MGADSSGVPTDNILGGGNYHGTYVSSIQFSPAQVAANTVAEQSMTIFTLAGIVPASQLANAIVHVNKPTAQAGLGVCSARLIDNGHIGVSFVNATAAPITPTAAETYRFVVIW